MKTLLTFSALFLFLLTSAQTTFKEKEVKRSVAGGNLYGTMLTPKKANGVAVVFISGSGPTDRDGNSAIAGKNNSIKMLAAAIGAKGYASLRFDKRAIGKSMPGYKEDSLRFDTYINDVVEWVAWLRRDKHVTKIVIVGHSEGSLLGMVAAQMVNADGFVSIAGAGFSADVILKQQLENQLPGKMYEQCVPVLDSLKAGYMVKNPPAALKSLFRPSVQPYLISWFKYNPAVEIAKLTCPVMILQGLNDLQVTQKDAESLWGAAPSARTVLMPKVTHVLKEAGETQAENLTTYANETLPLAPMVINNMLIFLAPLTK